MKPTFEFVCSYYHDGTWWAVSIQAYDWEDAEARVKKLGNLRLDGQVVARVPCRWMARLWCWMTNLGK